jgi:pimeloyl-ACP methyl ester carboxylesterase
MSTWVLLRGLAREARHWAELPERLHCAGLGDPVVFADLPGNGAHYRVRAPLDVDAMVDFVRADLARRGYTPPFSLLAMSLGAMAAVRWAQREAGEIDRLVLVNTSVRPYCSMRERLRPSAWADLIRAARRWRDRRRAEAAIHRLTCNRCDLRDTDIAVWIAIYRSAPVTRTNALRQLYAAARFKAERRPPACPTIVLASRRDALVDPACSAQLAAAWGTAFAEHPWAGHDLPHDDPQWLAQAVVSWAHAAGAANPLSGQSCIQ